MRHLHIAAAVLAIFVPATAAVDDDAAETTPTKTDVRYPDYNRINKKCPGYKSVRDGNNFMTHGGQTKLQIAGDECNIYGYDMSELIVKVDYETENRLHVAITDPYERAYQVPDNVLPRPDSQNIDPELSALVFSYTANPFSFQITRRSTGEVLFDTSAASLVFESQYIRLRTKLPQDPYLYGLGEHADPFRLKTTNYTRTFWNRDAATVPQESNLYGTHPFYLEQRENGTHGVFLLNSNGMDVFIDKDDDGEQYLEYNTLGGVLDLYFVAGPNPVDVVQQYGEIIGKPAMQPYWGLGFHQCRYGYQDAFEVAEVVQNYSNAMIPLETMWTDIDYMDRRRVFTLDPKRYPKRMMRDLVNTLHANDQKYIVMVDPAVAWVYKPWTDDRYMPLRRGLWKKAFLKRNNGSEWLGVVWPGPTVFPDWFAPGTESYWKGEFRRFFHRKSGVDIDGVWIDMNEPSNAFCPFPCDDPFDTALRAGVPPPAPPVRDPPRPLPGFPCSFQPKWAASAECLEEDRKDSKGKRSSDGGSDSDVCDDCEEFFGRDLDLVLDDYDQDADLWEEDRFLRSIDDEEFANLLREEASRPSNITAATASPPQASLQRRDFESQLEIRKLGFQNRDLLYPQYAIRNKAALTDAYNADMGGLSNMTVNTDLIHSNGLAMYDTHNLYGAMMGAATRAAMLSRRPRERPFIISRSTFAGSGATMGHWLGDNVATWDKYREAIRGGLAFAALFHVPMVGADVCGFQGNTTEELCARWAAMGAFMPFYRNHNDLGLEPQEFYRWPAVADSARRAIDVRYRLLDYFYTALWRASTAGTPALYPMFFFYPSDRATWALELQYFYGPALLVCPVTEESATSVDVYLPAGALFYDFHTHEPIRGRGALHTLPAPLLSDIPLLLRAGVIVPLRVASAMTTAALRRQGFELLVPVDDDDAPAHGELYLDDGKSLRGASTHVWFSYEAGVLSIGGDFDYDAGVVIHRVTILGGKTSSPVSSNEEDQQQQQQDKEKRDRYEDDILRENDESSDDHAAADQDKNSDGRRHSITYDLNIPLTGPKNITMTTDRINNELNVQN